MITILLVHRERALASKLNCSLYHLSLRARCGQTWWSWAVHYLWTHHQAPLEACFNVVHSYDSSPFVILNNMYDAVSSRWWCMDDDNDDHARARQVFLCSSSSRGWFDHGFADILNMSLEGWLNSAMKQAILVRFNPMIGFTKRS